MTEQGNKHDLAMRAADVAGELWPLLYGQGERVQAIALADCVAMWIAGHVDKTELRKPKGQRPSTDAFRKAEFAAFCTLVMDLVDDCEAQIIENLETCGNA